MATGFGLNGLGTRRFCFDRFAQRLGRISPFVEPSPEELTARGRLRSHSPPHHASAGQVVSVRRGPCKGLAFRHKALLKEGATRRRQLIEGHESPRGASPASRTDVWASERSAQEPQEFTEPNQTIELQERMSAPSSSHTESPRQRSPIVPRGWVKKPPSSEVVMLAKPTESGSQRAAVSCSAVCEHLEEAIHGLRPDLEFRPAPPAIAHVLTEGRGRAEPKPRGWQAKLKRPSNEAGAALVFSRGSAQGTALRTSTQLSIMTDSEVSNYSEDDEETNFGQMALAMDALRPRPLEEEHAMSKKDSSRPVTAVPLTRSPASSPQGPASEKREFPRQPQVFSHYWPQRPVSSSALPRLPADPALRFANAIRNFAEPVRPVVQRRPRQLPPQFRALFQRTRPSNAPGTAAGRRTAAEAALAHSRAHEAVSGNAFLSEDLQGDSSLSHMSESWGPSKQNYWPTQSTSDQEDVPQHHLRFARLTSAESDRIPVDEDGSSSDEAPEHSGHPSPRNARLMAPSPQSFIQSRTTSDGSEMDDARSV